MNYAEMNTTFIMTRLNYDTMTQGHYDTQVLYILADNKIYNNKHK